MAARSHRMLKSRILWFLNLTQRHRGAKTQGWARFGSRSRAGASDQIRIQETAETGARTALSARLGSLHPAIDRPINLGAPTRFTRRAWIRRGLLCGTGLRPHFSPSAVGRSGFLTRGVIQSTLLQAQPVDQVPRRRVSISAPRRAHARGDCGPANRQRRKSLLPRLREHSHSSRVRSVSIVKEQRKGSDFIAVSAEREIPGFEPALGVRATVRLIADFTFKMRKVTESMVRSNRPVWRHRGVRSG